MTTPRVSILLPVHADDIKYVEGVVDNLLETAADPSAIEFCFAVDSAEAADVLTPHIIALPHITTSIINGSKGYRGLHRHWNELAAVAEGRWLMLWNCDAKMLTDGWDTYLDKFTDDICVVQPEDNHNALAFVIFPRLVNTLLGHVTHHAFMDYWINELMRRGGWPQHREGFIQVAHAWDHNSPRAPESREMQKDFHVTSYNFWHGMINADVTALQEAYANHIQS